MHNDYWCLFRSSGKRIKTTVMKTLKLMSSVFFIFLLCTMAEAKALGPGCGYFYIPLQVYHSHRDSQSYLNGQSSFVGYGGGGMRRHHHRFSYKHVHIAHSKKWNR
ncbi:MAG: hypothetical protein JWO58_2347 [Chitinophagaceae bacterium]|nr:hypothetical protein [Chitinophagaceae bacterium]